MKSFILSIGLAAILLLPSFSQAESIVCGTDLTSTDRTQTTKRFWIFVDRNESAEKWTLVIELSLFRFGELSNRLQLKPVKIFSRSSGPNGNRAFRLERGEELVFRPTHVKNSFYHGELIYYHPGTADFAQIIENCYLDPKEVGFIIKN